MNDTASGSYKEESSAYEYYEESADEEFAPEYYSTDDSAPEGDYYYWEEEPELPSANEEYNCLLYTSDAADDLLCVDLGGRRIIKKKQ